MKMPRRPPNGRLLLSQFLQETDVLERVLALQDVAAGEKYLHWDKLIHYPAPEGFTHEEWWMALKLHRGSQFKVLPLKDVEGEPFQYLLFDPMMKILHEIDLGTGGMIQMPDPITNPATRDRYCINSLIEEAITSSQLEGATTTRLIAKEMIRSGRPPRDRSEQMILNNYRTMQRIGQIKDRPLTRDLVLEIHRMVTEDTLDDPSAAGRFRLLDEKVVVADVFDDTVFHHPPPAGQLQERMEDLCRFANAQDEAGFIHPVIRSIILHFWLAYDHPFVDGNGRTARALFYWSMLHQGFWLFEFVSISRILKNAPAQYGRSFLYTETDENDLTYFLIHQLDVIRRSIKDLYAYLKRRTDEIQRAEKILKGMKKLNHRQEALVAHALRHPYPLYTVESHRMSHNIAYGTAYNDLQDLVAKGLLSASKAGKAWQFRPAKDLERRLGGEDDDEGGEG